MPQRQNNKPKRKPARRQPPPPRVPRPPRGSVAATRVHPPQELVTKVCALTDPFCPHAIGAQIYSPSNLRTVPFTQHYRVVMSTDSNGSAAHLCAPSYFYAGSTGAVVGSGATYTALSPNGAVFPGTNPNRVRLVTAGIIVRSIAAPLSAAGMVYLRTFAQNNLVTLQTAELATYNCVESSDTPLRTTNATAAVFQRTDIKAREFFNPVNTNPTNQVVDMTGNGWSQLTVSIIGGPISTPVLEIEFLMHWELVFEDNTALSTLAVPTPRDSPLLSGAVDNVQSAMSSLFERGVSAAGSYVVRAAKTALMAQLSARFPPGAALLAL